MKFEQHLVKKKRTRSFAMGCVLEQGSGGYSSLPSKVVQWQERDFYLQAICCGSVGK